MHHRCALLIACLGSLSLAGCSSPPLGPDPDDHPDASSDATDEPDAPGMEAGDAGMDAAAEASGEGGLEAGADAESEDGAADGSSPDTDCDRLATFETQLVAAADAAARLALVDAFQASVFAAGGFPIRCGGKAMFLFRAPGGFGTPHVAGDFNGFVADAAPMTKVEGDAWRATLDVEPGAKRFKYKVTDGTQWVADPLARRFGFDQYGEYSLVSGGVDAGHLERLPEYEGAGLKSRPVTVYLPPGYETSSSSYPVLYAHDGQNLFDPSAIWGSWKLDAAIEGQLAASSIQPFVVIGIHNTVDRMDEYTHVEDRYDNQVVGGKADAYYELITQTIMPDVAKRYRLMVGPANTWTMGSSLGGLISLYFGMKHPDVFGRVAGLSSTCGWGSIDAGMHNTTIIELLPTLGKPAAVFYLDSGGAPGTGCEDSDSDGIEDDTMDSADNYCESIQMRDAFEAAGYVYDQDLFHWWEPQAEHNEAAWAARVFRPLQVLAKP
ncbi:MAG TPA: alpha/beta hydrolase-fold protein [Polyangiaceae bacterium]|nr:alpha/beta hydrolase-fold protein [Polyangiaceae bacterium]